MKLTHLKALRASWKPSDRASDNKFGLAAELIPSRAFTRANKPRWPHRRRPTEVERIGFRDKTVMEIQPSGALVRIYPCKPWANKAERKVILRERREDRALALANIGAQVGVI